MRRLWRIGLSLLAIVLIAAAVGFLRLLTADPTPAAIHAAGPGGRAIHEGRLLANYYPAEGGGRVPGVLVLGGAEGGIGSDPEALARLIARSGFSVLHPAYHNAPGLPSKLVNVPLEIFYDALDWLKRQPRVDANRVAIVGYSKGAEAALLVATRYSGIRAVALGMPSSVVWDGMSPANYMFGSFSSSWSEEGRPVASLPYVGRPDGSRLLPVFVRGLKHLDAHRNAIIPVERFGGRLMMVCGGSDTLWPSCPMTHDIVGRLRRHGRTPPLILRYPDAGHGVFGAPFEDRGALRRWTEQMGGTERANAVARIASSAELLRFLHEALDGTSR